MLKEAFSLFTFFIILAVLLYFFKSKKKKVFVKIIAILLTVATVPNIFFTVKSYLPEFILDESIPLGDMKNNLLLYKDDSEYMSQIFFPLVANRTVFLDNSPGLYSKMFGIFSKEVSDINISEDAKEQIMTNSDDFVYNQLCYLPKIMDYAIEDGIFLLDPPSLYINIDSIKKGDSLVAFEDENWNLYIMSDKYYTVLTGDTIN